MILTCEDEVLGARDAEKWTPSSLEPQGYAKEGARGVGESAGGDPSHTQPRCNIDAVRM